MRNVGDTGFVRVVAITTAVSLVLAACAPGYQRRPFTPPTIDFRSVSSGVVATPGVAIAAMDGSFTLTSVPFATPFDQGGGCLVKPVAQDSMSGLATGARRVKVRLPAELAAVVGGKQEIYGVLSLCGAPPGAKGAATRAYALQVPVERLEQLEGGRVSVAYEVFLWDPYQLSAGRGGDGVAWILWLSTRPFPESDGSRNAQTTEEFYVAVAQAEHEREEDRTAAGQAKKQRMANVLIVILSAMMAVGLGATVVILATK